MPVRGILRVASVGLAIGVAALVWLQWEEQTPVFDEGVSTPGSQTDAIQSRTEGLNYTHTVHGVPRYRIRANESLGFVSGRNEWSGDVELVIYPPMEEEGKVPEPIVVTADKMQTRERASGYEEVRVTGDVRARLPSGAEIVSTELTYREAASQVETDAGVLLRHAGLLITANSMRYESDAGRLRMLDAVELRADPNENSAPRGFVGHAESLIRESEASVVVLRGEPALQMHDAALEGRRLLLHIDEELNELLAIETQGGGRAVWTSAAATGEYAIRGEPVMLELGDDGEPRRLYSEADGTRAPTLQVGSDGDLRAHRIDLVLQSEGRSEVVASGEAIWNAAADELGIEQLVAGTLRLAIGSDGLESAAAEDTVRVRLPSSDEGGVQLEGERASFRWDDARLVEGEWPAGFGYRLDGRSLRAARGSYDPDGDRWVMSGTPRPRLEDEQIAVEAERMLAEPGELLEAIGSVSAELRGEQLDMLTTVFGEDGPVNVGAASLVLDERGTLRFRGGSRLWSGEQVMTAESVAMSSDSGALEATGGVFVTLDRPSTGAGGQTRPGQPAAGESGPLRLSGDRLLIEGDPPELRVVDGVRLQEGDRVISGENVVVRFVEGGGWAAIEVRERVRMQDPDGTAEGQSLSYDPNSGVVTVLSAPQRPATFSNDKGVDIRDGEGLRFEWTDDELTITALQQGTTQTVRSGQ